MYKFTKREIIERYRKLFTDLLNEKNQNKTAKEIAIFSEKINEYIKGYPELEEIQNACLPMEHWKDETGFCNLTEKDIEQFLEKLRPKKLVIVGRKNKEGGFYIKFKENDDAIVALNSIAWELGNNIIDEDYGPRTFELQNWKDDLITFKFKKTIIEIICGEKYIHFFVRGKENREEINKVIKKYSEWTDITN